ncbi:MAG: hypothetical protein M3O70_12690 [Actinomycetota bacterium]|nr:hypothetical protein [Actinomycetota bacterium]
MRRRACPAQGRQPEHAATTDDEGDHRRPRHDVAQQRVRGAQALGRDGRRIVTP